MGVYVRARASDRGIERLLTNAGIKYFPFVELGNPFVELPDWADRYRRLLALAGDLLIERLGQAPEPFCLMCARRAPLTATGN